MPSEKSQTDVRLDKQGDVATITFFSGEGVNIFSSRVVGLLGEAVEKVATDARLRFVVIRGEGKVFMAGADIAQMHSFTPDQALAFGRKGHTIFDALERLPQVTFAAINGHALGGGTEVSMACDFRIAVATAKLGQPETRLGLIPGWGGTQRMPRLLPLGVARRLLFSGEQITAEYAKQIGLVDEVVPTPADLDAALQRWFAALAPASPNAIKHVKRSLLTGKEAEEFAECFVSDESRAGIGAFLEKKPAPWTTRS